MSDLLVRIAATVVVLGLVAYVAGRFAACDGPLRGVVVDERVLQSFPAAGLGLSIDAEHAYQAVISGKLPAELRGTLYRNGPGSFDRGGQRKRCLLDGDGMVQSFRIADGAVQYRNRFVRTAKFEAETEAGHLLLPTWSTQAPGGIWKNLGGGIDNQAGVSVVPRSGRLFAFDDHRAPYEIDPDSLATVGLSWIGMEAGSTVFSAHSIIDGVSGEWILFGIEYGKQAVLHLTILSPENALVWHRSHPLPSHTYLHDFLATSKYLIINLHPAEIDLVSYLSGRHSMTSSLRWRPELGNQVLVFERLSDRPPQSFAAPAAWMWHAVNAYDVDGKIVADFIGYDNPDHFLGSDPAMFAIMEGRRGTFDAPGTLRRYTIDLDAAELHEEIIRAECHEFPIVNPALRCHRHLVAYFASIEGDDAFFNSIARVHTGSGERQVFRFPTHHYCGEPVFAPRPTEGGRDDGGRDAGWLLSQVYDGVERRTYLAVFDSEDLTSGPVATVHLEHPVPIAFHGAWLADRGPAEGEGT